MLAVYKSLALAQTAQIWQSVKKSQVARTRAKAKRLNIERVGMVGRVEGLRLKHLLGKTQAKKRHGPSLLLSHPMMQSECQTVLR